MGHPVPSNSSKMQKLGVFWKIQDICYKMGTEIFKIEEEMTEKMKLIILDLHFVMTVI